METRTYVNINRCSAVDSVENDSGVLVSSFPLLYLVSSLLLLFLTVPGAQAKRTYDCHWLGTGPICSDGVCPSGYTTMVLALDASYNHLFGDFGSICLHYPNSTGKTLCCKDESAAQINKYFDKCHWMGTAPMCQSAKCSVGFSEVSRSSSVASAPADSIFRNFGERCQYGDKALCCKQAAYPNETCAWIGNAPVCMVNVCPVGTSEVVRSAVPLDGSPTTFGESCMIGKKSLCCGLKKAGFTPFAGLVEA
ncbi:hypothetical protein PRIPAC_73644 [Pristionchus pacificus]|uniref:Uncharacterized protein n=1 Tax=Pristionchus pacificus TaxID=54126 RepID=A0A2A6C7M4_PRIPA|nr:hypothetical protein PRIPAC_73644 [Pristionchus pacificus]|eukprot:PDM74078.1 hypothetical protein PRIPAC_41434 [Pristionchus pacificus]